MTMFTGMLFRWDGVGLPFKSYSLWDSTYYDSVEKRRRGWKEGWNTHDGSWDMSLTLTNVSKFAGYAQWTSCGSFLSSFVRRPRFSYSMLSSLRQSATSSLPCHHGCCLIMPLEFVQTVQDIKAKQPIVNDWNLYDTYREQTSSQQTFCTREVTTQQILRDFTKEKKKQRARSLLSKRIQFRITAGVMLINKKNMMVVSSLGNVLITQWILTILTSNSPALYITFMFSHEKQQTIYTSKLTVYRKTQNCIKCTAWGTNE